MEIDNKSLNDSYLEKGQALLEEGKVDEAIAMFGITASDSNEELTVRCESLFQIGLCYLVGKGDLNNSLRYFDQCLEKLPTHSNAIFNRATVKLNKQDFRGAIQDLDNYILLNPTDPEGYQNRGFAKIQLGDHEGALKDFDGALELQPDNYGLLNNRANLSMNVFNNQQRAMEDLNKAVELFPEEYVAYKNRGGLRAQLEDHQGAMDDLKKCATLLQRLVGSDPMAGAQLNEVKDLMRETLEHMKEDIQAGKKKNKA